MGLTWIRTGVEVPDRPDPLHFAERIGEGHSVLRLARERRAARHRRPRAAPVQAIRIHLALPAGSAHHRRHQDHRKSWLPTPRAAGELPNVPRSPSARIPRGPSAPVPGWPDGRCPRLPSRRLRDGRVRPRSTSDAPPPHLCVGPPARAGARCPTAPRRRTHPSPRALHPESRRPGPTGQRSNSTPDRLPTCARRRQERPCPTPQRYAARPRPERADHVAHSWCTTIPLQSG